MEDISWWQALILGIIQGLTEYLPISSSGHLVIFGTFLGINGEDNLLFTIVVHAATVLSTIVVLRKEIAELVGGLLKFQWNEETQYTTKILISMIPVAIVGIFFKEYVEGFFGSGLTLVSCMLLVTAALLTLSYHLKPHRRPKSKISFKDAFVIGISQAIAVLPGLSRSGTTISTGLLLGNKKENIAKFSFLMVIIPILGEAFLNLLKMIKGGSSTQSHVSPLALVVGFLTAFIFGTIACKWMLNIIKQKKLIYFAYYCAIVGLFFLAFLYWQP